MTTFLCTLLRPCRIPAVLSLLAICGTASRAFIIALLLAGVAVADPVITPIIVTEQPAGSYDFPVAPVLDAGKTRSDTCYYHSEHTANTTGDSNIALGVGASYQWTLSAAGSNQHASIQVYRLEAAGGGNPSLSSPTAVAVDGMLWYSMNCGQMDPGSWCFGDAETPALGYSTLYVAMLDQSKPDPDDASYGDDIVVAVYGQGAETKRHCITGNYDKDTGALVCTDNFLLYGWTSGDRILIQHANINSGTPTWTTISSKTDKDGVVVATGLSASDITDNTVEIFTHMDPYTDGRFKWVTADAIYTYQNTDDRYFAASTTVPTLGVDGPYPVWAPLLQSNGFSTRTEDVEFTFYDDWNSLSSSTTTLTYDDSFWSGAREIFIDATLGTDVGSCTTTNSPSACTVVSPCQTFGCGVSQLCRTTGRAILRVKRGETYNLTADVDLISDSDPKWIDGAGYGSGADPIIETSPSGTGYTFGGTTSNIRVNDLQFVRTGGCTSCTRLMSVNTDKSLFFRNEFVNGAGQSSVLLQGHDYAFLDNITRASGTGMQYTVFAMGGDGISAHTLRHKAFIGNQFLATNISDAVFRVGIHEGVIAFNHSRVVSDATNQVFAPLRIANDAFPHYGLAVASNYLKRDAGTTSGAYLFAITAQFGGRVDHLRFGNNFLGAHSGDLSQDGMNWDFTLTQVAIRNNVFVDVDRPIVLRSGIDLDVTGNSAYMPVSGIISFLATTSGATGYRNVWLINDVMNAPNSTSTSPSRFLNMEGSDVNVARVHIHKTMVNRNNVANWARIASTNYGPAAYESARAGLDVIGGGAANDSDPKFAAASSFDLRLCTGTDIPVVGCTTSPAIDAGFTGAGFVASYDGTLRPVDMTNDIGAFEMDTQTGTCCECDGTCTDDSTAAACTALMGVFSAGETCGVEGCDATGACCTTIEGNCSVITDACCAASQWLTGDTCADCEWRCCHSDGTCANETEAVCDGLTNATFTWGTSCSGDCATVACCNGVSCSDLTAEACAALGRTSAGTGTDCGTGSPCAGPTSGSCCKTDGTCEVLTEAACDAITDAIWSDGGNCTPNICAPAWACCMDDETCAILTDAACTAVSGNWQDGVAGCFPQFCTLGGCCDVDTACTITIETECTADHWFFSDPDCNGSECNPGTCCTCDDTCTDALENECLDSGAVFSSGDTCAGEGCPASTGACCVGATCSVITSACCTLFEGFYNGNGSACGATSCGPPIGSSLLLGVGR